MGGNAIGVRGIRLIRGDCPRSANQPIATVARIMGTLTNLSVFWLIAADRQGTNPAPQPSDAAAGTIPVGPAGTVPGWLEIGTQTGLRGGRNWRSKPIRLLQPPPISTAGLSRRYGGRRHRSSRHLTHSRGLSQYCSARFLRFIARRIST